VMAAVAVDHNLTGISDRSNKLDTVLAISLVLVGMCFPTSIQGDISKPLLGAFYCVALLLLALIIKRQGTAGFLACLFSFLMIPVLLLFTLTSGLTTYKPGALVGYAALSVLYVVNLKALSLRKSFFGFFAVMNVLTICVATAILVGYDGVTKFIVANYSSFYPELVQYMMDVRKPVLTFGAHSIAGLLLYFFFFAALQTWRLKKSKLFLVFAHSYVLILYSLLSVTGLTFGTVALFQLFYWLWHEDRKLLKVTLSLTFVIAISMALFLSSVIPWDDGIDAVKLVLTSTDGGLSGRFLPEGTLYGDLQYLRDNSFSPVGVSFAEQLQFGDSGIVEHLLRGSLPLVLMVYGGLFFFLRRNLVARADVYLIFFSIMAFEAGYSTLTTGYRTLCLIPFFIIYLNYLRRLQSVELAGGMASSSGTA
jgi:hypothetical protein